MLSKNTTKLVKTLYWIIGFFSHLYVCYLLFVTDRAITGIIWFILGLILLFVMYLYYFPNGNTNTWPPYVTVCPDYLTSVTPTACMDFVGLHNQYIKKANPSNLPQPSESEYSRYVFDPTGTKNQKITNAQSKGLTWEGLY